MTETKRFAGIAAALVVVFPCPASAWFGTDLVRDEPEPATEKTRQPPPHCQILDERRDPIYAVSVGVIPDSRFEGYGKGALVEIDADWDIARWRDVLFGDLRLGWRSRLTFLPGSSDVPLPDQFGRLALLLEWVWRLPEGPALAVGGTPGIYSDLERLGANSFYAPFSLRAIQCFNRSLSGVLGVEVRPGFDRRMVPIVGLDWTVARWLFLRTAVPESRLVWRISSAWETHIVAEWESTSYGLRDESRTGQNQVTLEDFRAWWGATFQPQRDLQFTLDVGSASGRSVRFTDADSGQDNDVAIDRQWLVRFGLGGPF